MGQRMSHPLWYALRMMMNDMKNKNFKVTFASGVVVTIEARNISLAIGILGNLTTVDVVAVEEIGRSN